MEDLQEIINHCEDFEIKLVKRYFKIESAYIGLKQKIRSKINDLEKTNIESCEGYFSKYDVIDILNEILGDKQ